MIIIGITGSIGAGKGTVVEYLRTRKGFKHFSARDFITKEIEKRGLPIDRDSMRNIGNELREIHSPSYIIESLYKEAQKSGGDCIIESIRTIGEIDALRKIGHFHLLAVSAELPIRYERILLRGNETDNVSFDTFVEQNEKEASSTDPHKQNIDACIKKSDIILKNNSSVEKLYREIEDFFHSIDRKKG